MKQLSLLSGWKEGHVHTPVFLCCADCGRAVVRFCTGCDRYRRTYKCNCPGEDPTQLVMLKGDPYPRSSNTGVTTPLPHPKDNSLQSEIREEIE